MRCNDSSACIIPNNAISPYSSRPTGILPFRYIDSFTQEDENTREKEAGQIWGNVVIVGKGKLAADLAMDTQGARMAAQQHNLHKDPLALRYVERNIHFFFFSFPAGMSLPQTRCWQEQRRP